MHSKKRPHVVAALLATTALVGMLFLNGKTKRLSATDAGFEQKLRNEILLDYEKNVSDAVMATEMPSFAMDDKNYLYVQPKDTSGLPGNMDPLNAYIDVDSLVAAAEKQDKTHIYFDARLEKAASRPSAWYPQGPEYKTMRVADLREVNDKIKRDGRIMGTKPVKLFMRFDGRNTASNHSYYMDTLARKYEKNTTVSMNTNFLWKNDKKTVKAGGSHEVGHDACGLQFSLNVLAAKVVSMGDSASFSQMVMKASRYFEYQCDSISVVLNDGDKLSPLFKRQDKINRSAVDSLEKNINNDNYELFSALILLTDKETKDQRRFCDDPDKIHPSNVNRIRNMRLVEMYHNSQNAFERSVLQSMMPQNPGVAWERAIMSGFTPRFHPPIRFPDYTR